MKDSASKKSNPIFYVIEIVPEEYDSIRTKNRFEVTLADIILKNLEDITAGDSLVFHCTSPRGEYCEDIERQISSIETDSSENIQYFYFKKEQLTSWKKRRS